MRLSLFVLGMRQPHHRGKSDPEGHGFARCDHGYYLAEKCRGSKGKLWNGVWKQWVRGPGGWGRLCLGDRGGGGRSWWFRPRSGRAEMGGGARGPWGAGRVGVCRRWRRGGRWGSGRRDAPGCGWCFWHPFRVRPCADGFRGCPSVSGPAAGAGTATHGYDPASRWDEEGGGGKGGGCKEPFLPRSRPRFFLSGTPVSKCPMGFQFRAARPWWTMSHP